MIMSVTLGLSWPLLTIVLERQGVPAWLVGLSASGQMVAVLAVVPVAPGLISRIGMVRTIALGITGMVACLFLLPMFPNVWAWFPIRFGLGLCEELVFIAGDIWINELASEKRRGRLIGVYGLFLHGGFLVGPAALMYFGSEDWIVLYLAIGVCLCGLIPLALAREPVSSDAEVGSARLLYFLRVMTALMLAGLLFGLIESSMESLLPVFALRNGLDADTAAFFLMFFVGGGLVAQLPVGWLADHVDPRRLLLVGAILVLASFVLLPFAIGERLAMAALMLVMGANLGGFFIVAMTVMGRLYKGADLISVNTSFVFIFGVGLSLGPILSGSAMSLFGANGMPGLGALLCAIFVVLMHRVGHQLRGASASG